MAGWDDEWVRSHFFHVPQINVNHDPVARRA